MCVDCGAEKNLSVHHIIPYSVNQDNGLWNLETLCRRCHAHKDLFFTTYGVTEFIDCEDRLSIAGKTIYHRADDPDGFKKKIDNAFEVRKYGQGKIESG